MKKVVAVKERTGGSLVSIKLDDKSAYTLRASTVSSLGIFAGGEVCDDTLSFVEKEDENIRAYNKALLILSYSDNSSRELYKKLLSKGFSSDAAELAVKKVKDAGYINEARQLEGYILKYGEQKLWGRYRIEAKLLSMGYGRADIEKAFEALYLRNELDFDKTKQLLIEKFKPESSFEKQKLLYKYGYKK